MLKWFGITIMIIGGIGLTYVASLAFAPEPIPPKSCPITVENPVNDTQGRDNAILCAIINDMDRQMIESRAESLKLQLFYDNVHATLCQHRLGDKVEINGNLGTLVGRKILSVKLLYTVEADGKRQQLEAVEHVED